jgi:ADP-heptose:LPS heptosyltransferase
MIKTAAIRKKINRSTNQRYIELKKPADYKRILVLNKSDPRSFENLFKKIFPNAKIDFISIREKGKIPEGNDLNTVHLNDFNLTGSLKNDNLKQLTNKQFDLAVDLSENSMLLQYMLVLIQPNLTIGKINTNEYILYDLSVEKGSNDADFIKNIERNIILLSKK